MSPSQTRSFYHHLCGAFLLLFMVSDAYTQTDATIFRDFQFDFATPGARANAMGRAFVGLADEATAAYSNPAGLSVLASPELAFEGRLNQAFYPPITGNEQFPIIDGLQPGTEYELKRVGFYSFSFSKGDFNFSTWFVNNLDYQRDQVAETIRFTRPGDTRESNYRNEHHVRHIQLNTQGVSVSRNFGKLSLGLGAGLAHLDLDFSYATRLFYGGAINTFHWAGSETEHTSYKPAWVLGALYQAHPRLKVGFSYKRQPQFTYTEILLDYRTYVENPSDPVPQKEQPVTFKIPDSAQLGIAYQPSDRWTILFDIDWTRYNQQINDFVQLSPYYVPRSITKFYTFDKDDYYISEDLNYRFGAEYLQPIGSNILALRAGAFLEPDHRTRFTGEPEFTGIEREDNILNILYDTQDFFYNTGEERNNFGLTTGFGFVLNNKFQVDAAYVHSDRFKRGVVSLLYRF